MICLNKSPITCLKSPQYSQLHLHHDVDHTWLLFVVAFADIFDARALDSEELRVLIVYGRDYVIHLLR